MDWKVYLSDEVHTNWRKKNYRRIWNCGSTCLILLCKH